MVSILAVTMVFFSSVPSPGLIAWFDAADRESVTVQGERIISWRNKAEGGGEATASAENAPEYLFDRNKGVRAAAYFDGMDTFLSIPAFNRKSDTWSLIAVAALYHLSSGGGICSAVPHDGADYDPGFTVDTYQSASSFDQINVEGAGRITGQEDLMTHAYPCGGLHVITVIRESEKIRLYVDGIAEGERTMNSAVTVMDELRIGARYYGGKVQGFFHGEMSQLFLYDHALGEGERKRIESILAVDLPERQAGEEAYGQWLIKKKQERMIAPKVVASWPTIAEYVAADTNAAPLESLPVRCDIGEAIFLGVRHLNSLYDRDRDDEPFFYINREADGTGKMRHSTNIGIPHVVGRCLLACMEAEQAAEAPFPSEGLAILERYCQKSFDNPDHLNSYEDPEKGGARFVEFHNMREGLYGLWALIAGRQSSWARETAHQMLETLDKLTDSEGLWSMECAKKLGMEERCQGFCSANAARMVDALLAYYDVSKDPLAMKLADAYARRGLKDLYLDDGHFAPMERSSGHVHSITSALSGITAYALRIHDTAMIDACRRIMDQGIPEYFSSWGWGDEVFPEHPANVVSRGEINQTGDIVRTAILLGEAGYSEYFETAERFLRSMLLPTQHRESELSKILKDRSNPVDDSEKDTVNRSIGGYAMQQPNDRMRAGDWPISTLDITSGAVHAMSEAYRHRTAWRNDACYVQLLFDFEDDGILLKSGLPLQGDISITVKKSVPTLAVRIPQWVDTASIWVMIEDQPTPWSMKNGYLEINSLTAGMKGRLTFAVPCKKEQETVDGLLYRTTWFGSQIIDIQPRGVESPLPF